ncbi:MAG: glycosyltransferase family 4 protein [Clostridiaceae bacterium]
MRILSLSAYYEPEIAASLYIFENINESYVNAGHDVVLYTPMPTRGVSKEVHNEYKNKKYEEKYNGKLKIHRFAMFNEEKKPVLRAFRYICCSLIHFFKSLFVEKIDIITVASTPPTQGVLAAIIKRIKKVPVIYYLQDIFPDSLVNAGLTNKGSLMWKIGRAIENYTYRNMDKIIVISEDLKKNIMAKGVPEEKIGVIYNWVDEKAVINVNRNQNKLFDKYNLDRSKFYFTYCGNIGFTQNMDMLLEVAKELDYNKNIKFVMIGDGSYKREVEKLIKKNNIENLKLLPFQPYEDISNVFSLGDVGLIISKENIGQNSVPSKAWSIMSAERPILASFDIDSQLSSIIRESDCGICVQAGQKEKLKQAILNMYNNKTEAVNKGLNGRMFILQNLTREIGTLKYNNIIKSINED